MPHKIDTKNETSNRKIKKSFDYEKREQFDKKSKQAIKQKKQEERAMPKVNYDKNNQQKIANRIQRELRQRGLKQKILVDIWRIGRPSVSLKMNGKTPITKAQVHAFEQAMGMKEDEIYDGLENFEKIPTKQHKTIGETIIDALYDNGKTEEDLKKIWGLPIEEVKQKINGKYAIKQSDIDLIEDELHMQPGTILAGNGILVGSTVHVEQNTQQQTQGKPETSPHAFLEHFRIVLKDEVIKALTRYATVFPEETKTTADWLTLCVALTPNDHEKPPEQGKNA